MCLFGTDLQAVRSVPEVNFRELISHYSEQYLCCGVASVFSNHFDTLDKRISIIINQIQWISLGTALIQAYSLFSACSLQHTGYSCITLELSTAVKLRRTAELSQTTQIVVYFVWQTNNGYNSPPYSLLLTWARTVSAEGADICLAFAFLPC